MRGSSMPLASVSLNSSKFRLIGGYSDMLVARSIEQVTVLSAEKISIRFIGGQEAEQTLS